MKTVAQREKAFSMVEVTLALGIAAFSLVTIFALLPIGLNTNRNAGEQVASSKLLAGISADLRGTPSAATSSPLFGIAIPASTASSTTTLFFNSSGQHTSALANDSRYRAVITFSPNSSSAASFATIRLTWPARADPANADGSLEGFVALARF